MNQDTETVVEVPSAVKKYSRFLLFVAGLGGLIYGMDVGIIAGALPFLKETAGAYLKDANLGLVVAAVLGGSVISSLFAGALADLFGRKKMLVVSALLFVLSIPVIAMSAFPFDGNGVLPEGAIWKMNIWGMGSYEVSVGFLQLTAGRILQGFSAGLIGVIVPLYLAECLSADQRGKGTGMFQLMLTIGLVLAALIAYGFTYFVEHSDMSKEVAWRGIFWVSVIPGLLLAICGLFISESPRWLFFKRNNEAAALDALRRGNPEKVAVKTMEEIKESAKASEESVDEVKDSLFQKKYIYPFILAVVILACTQATGINSMLNYSVSIFHQGGLEGTDANAGDIALKVANCVMTLLAVSLVDRKGRKFLLKIGTSGIVIGLCTIGFLFLGIENSRTDVTKEVATMVQDKSLNVNLQDEAVLAALGVTGDSGNKQLILNYSQGDKNSLVFNFTKKKIENGEEVGLEPGIADIKKATPDNNGNIVDLKILRAEIGEKPSPTTGWLIVGAFVFFIASFGIGPGVCVWLALSELMPNRIRSNGMSIALLINQAVSTCIAAFFLPVVADIGFSSIFFILAGFTVIYFITVTFFLPETKGKTLEEIEEYFTKGTKKA